MRGAQRKHLARATLRTPRVHSAVRVLTLAVLGATWSFVPTELGATRRRDLLQSLTSALLLPAFSAAGVKEDYTETDKLGEVWTTASVLKRRAKELEQLSQKKPQRSAPLPRAFVTYLTRVLINYDAKSAQVWESSAPRRTGAEARRAQFAALAAAVDLGILGAYGNDAAGLLSLAKALRGLCRDNVAAKRQLAFALSLLPPELQPADMIERLIEDFTAAVDFVDIVDLTEAAAATDAELQLLQPLDVVKITQQLSTETREEEQGGVFDSFLSTASLLSRDGGLGALYKGTGATILATSVMGFTSFGLNEFFRRSLEKWRDPYAEATAPIVLAASIGSIFVASILACPFETLRVRVMAPSERRSFGEITKEAIEGRDGRGLPSLWAGLVPFWAREIPFSACKFLVFDLASRALFAVFAPQAETSLGISALAGALAGLMSAIVWADAVRQLSTGEDVLEGVATVRNDSAQVASFAKLSASMLSQYNPKQLDERWAAESLISKVEQRSDVFTTEQIRQITNAFEESLENSFLQQHLEADDGQFAEPLPEGVWQTWELEEDDSEESFANMDFSDWAELDPSETAPALR
eukprot:g28847.t1